MNLQLFLDALVANTEALKANTAALSGAATPKPRGRPVKGVEGDETAPVGTTETVQQPPKSDSKPPIENKSPEPAPAKAPTLEEVSKLAMAFAKDKGANEFKAVLLAVGAPNLSGVKPDKLPEFVSRLRGTWKEPDGTPKSEEENLFA